MIGTGLKKLAAENGMKVAHGVAYGSLQGYAATLSEGSGYKKIEFGTQFPDAQQKTALLSVLEQTDTKKLYRVQGIGFAARSVQVVFLDNPGTMTKIRAFIDWFLPLLRQHGATGYQVCPECGSETLSGRWVLIGGVAHYMHDACAEKVRRDLTESEEAERQQSTGSYGSGLLGALLGATLGAAVWAVVLMLGYVASLVGLLIGWLAQKGYDLLKGKQGKGKLAILIVSIIFGVLLGTFAADAYQVYHLIQDGTLYGLTVMDIPMVIFVLLQEDPQYRSATIANVAMGLLFAGLGVFALLKKTGQEISGTKIIDLE